MELDVDVLFDDGGLVVLDKPAGLAMHGGVGVRDDESLHGAMRDAWDIEPGFAGPSFLGRLDRPTSGLVVAALSRDALRSVEPSWREGLVVKEYLVLVHGAVEARGVIDVPLAARRPRLRGSGRVEDARTEWRRLAGSARASLVCCRLVTGRTHQLRRHWKAAGHPIAGDTRYGHEARDRDLGTTACGLLLHAWRLQHGGSVPRLPHLLEAAPPARLVETARLLGLGAGIPAPSAG
ncbi:MAG: RNA pseudouridine synthase [Deltaproteobacteria bacterium]|nr:RNA pseudouridine synthase [Deltaproteobacteria bacterium]